MSLESLTEEPVKMSNKELKQVGRSVSSLLMVATEEQRVTCGLKPAIHALETEPDEVLFCVLPQTRDPTTHIQAVLLQAFCYEQNIAIIKVDSLEKVRDIVGKTDCSCVLIHKNLKRLLCLELELDRTLQRVERSYVTQPVFKLPAK